MCETGDVCVDGTCCDTASAGDCSVTDEDVGYDADDCIRDLPGAGQCRGGWGTFIAEWSQTSTHGNAIGPGTVDVAGCADVEYTECVTIFIGIGEGHWFDCLWLPMVHTDNMGTHDECPSE